MSISRLVAIYFLSCSFTRADSTRFSMLYLPGLLRRTKSSKWSFSFSEKLKNSPKALIELVPGYRWPLTIFAITQRLLNPNFRDQISKLKYLFLFFLSDRNLEENPCNFYN